MSKQKAKKTGTTRAADGATSAPPSPKASLADATSSTGENTTSQATPTSPPSGSETKPQASAEDASTVGRTDAELDALRERATQAEERAAKAAGEADALRAQLERKDKESLEIMDELDAALAAGGERVVVARELGASFAVSTIGHKGRLRRRHIQCGRAWNPEPRTVELGRDITLADLEVLITDPLLKVESA